MKDTQTELTENNRLSEEQILERFRELCLSLPETSETASWGHPNFRAGKQTFATFEWVDHRPSMAFRLTGDEIVSYMGDSRFFFSPCGHNKWVSLWVDSGRVDWAEVNRLIHLSYRLVSPKHMITWMAD